MFVLSHKRGTHKAVLLFFKQIYILQLILLFMKTELNKKEAEKKINSFFSDIKDKNKEEMRKIKRLAMHYKIKLKDKRKLFCKYCFSSKLKTRRIKNKIKSVECEDCGKLMRWKIGKFKKNNSN